MGKIRDGEHGRWRENFESFGDKEIVDLKVLVQSAAHEDGFLLFVGEMHVGFL